MQPGVDDRVLFADGSMWLEGTSGVFSENRFRQRVRVVSVVFASLFGMILLRLFFLQIIRGDDLARMSESNRTQVIFLRAPRGDFLDRNGLLLTTNRPSWSLMYSVPDAASDTIGEIEENLAPLLDPISTRWRAQLRRAHQTKRMVRLVEDVANEVAFGLRELGDLVPGARMEMEYRRGTTDGNVAAHVIGYLGEIDDRELRDVAWEDRRMGDLIGKTGLERIMDRDLRGQDGGTVIEVDSGGRLRRVINDLPSKRGHAVSLTLDRDIQQTAVEGLALTATKRGAAVVLDVRTGDVLTWASAPSFNPGQILASDLRDTREPFFDRVYKGAYPPGSLFKIITAVAALERGQIRFNHRVHCQGYAILRDRQQVERRFHCWKTHGSVDYWKAMAESCNVYFYQMGETVGAQPMFEAARLFGLGETVQSVLPSENAGVIPNSVWKRRQGWGGWSTGDTYNMSIGQGYVTSTPLQMAVMTMAVANRGKIFRPKMIQKVTNPAGKTTFSSSPAQWRVISLKEPTWDHLQKSMREVIKKGTGKVCDIPYLDVLGKTGTAQAPRGEDHAWFSAYAGYPGEPPQIAVVVFVENGGGGGATAGPIARRIIEKALPPRPPEVPVG